MSRIENNIAITVTFIVFALQAVISEIIKLLAKNYLCCHSR